MLNTNKLKNKIHFAISSGITFSCLLLFILLLSGCLQKEAEIKQDFLVGQDKEENEEIQRTKHTTTSVDGLVDKKDNVDIDTSDWITYNNEEYGFEFKYPKGWYWEDHTEEFKSDNGIVGFYPPNKEREWEYFGDLYVEIFEKKEQFDVVNFFKSEYSDMPFLFENLVTGTTKNGYNYVKKEDISGNIDVDTVFIKCNNNIISFSTPFGLYRDGLDEVIKTLLCE